MLALIVLLASAGIARGDLASNRIDDRYPNYLASIEFHGKHICAGTIITTTKIMTAGSCINVLPLEYVKIRAGTLTQSEGGQVRAVTRIVVHPQYNKPTLNNDIGVLLLAEPLILNNEVDAVILRPDDNIPTDVNPTVVGRIFGRNMIPSNDIKKIDTAFYDPRECERRLGHYEDRSMICTESIVSNDYCQPVAGSPLMLRGAQIGMFLQGNCRADTPDTFTRTGYYFEFIYSETYP